MSTLYIFKILFIYGSAGSFLLCGMGACLVTSAVSDSLQPHGPWPTQTRLSMGFSRQECWSGVPYPSPGDLPDPGTEPASLHCTQIIYCLSHQESRRKIQSDLSITKIPLDLRGFAGSQTVGQETLAEPETETPTKEFGQCWWIEQIFLLPLNLLTSLI